MGQGPHFKSCRPYKIRTWRVITLDDGSTWFAERGPIDYWDWEIEDEVAIEPIETPYKNSLGDIVEYRIINLTRNEFVECALLDGKDKGSITRIMIEGKGFEKEE